MKYTYLEKFDKTSIDDMEAVQAVISETGSMLDSKLFPLIDEAEKGDFGAMAELYEMFTYGNNDILPNYELAMRYCTKLIEKNSSSNDHDLISEGLNARAYLYHNFSKDDLAHDAFLEAFKYMVANLEPHLWDKQIVNLVTDYVNGIELGEVTE